MFWFVSGHDFSRAEKPFIFLPEPALAGGTRPCFDFSRSLFRRADQSGEKNRGLSPRRNNLQGLKPNLYCRMFGTTEVVP